jgi:hypothetical protein
MLPTHHISQKSGLAAFILCLFFGALGIHRFYVGKIGTGILMLLTLGGLGFWMLYDLFSIVCKNFTDKQGLLVEIKKSPKAPRNVVIAVLCFYIVFLGSVTAILGTSLSGVSSVGKNELTALRHGNVEQAYAYTSSAFQKAVNIETFRKFVNSYPQLLNNTSSTFTDVEFNNDKGSIVGTLNTNDGHPVPIEILLVKENNQWKINEINITKSENPAVTPDASQTTDQKPATAVAPKASNPVAPEADKEDATQENTSDDQQE